MSIRRFWCPLVLVGTFSTLASTTGNPVLSPAKVVSDILFVWGNPDPSEAYELSKSGPIKTQDIGKFAQADPASRAAMLGVKNVVMAGSGLPDEEGLAKKWSVDIAKMNRIVWELIPDGQHEYREQGKFEYDQKVSLLKKLRDQYSQIEAVLLDDMSTVAVSKGFKPEHIAGIRTALGSYWPGISIWGVVYELSLNDEHLSKYLAELDVINFWIWHAKEVGELEKRIEVLEKMAPGKPIVLGLYMYDYGENRKMPADLMKTQCEKALALARAKRIQGIVFLSVHNDPEIIEWTRDWIRSVSNTDL